MKKVLIIASNVTERLSLVSKLREQFLLETRSSIPSSLNEFRELTIEGIIISLDHHKRGLELCRKIQTSSLNYWVCLYDRHQKLKEVDQIVTEYDIAGYWGGKSSEQFLRFIQQCSTGESIIHKRESRMNRFLGIMSKIKRER